MPAAVSSTRCWRGTIFAQTKTGLARWLLAIYLVTSSKGGISAMALQRQMGLGTAWGWRHKIRKAMVRPRRALPTARVESGRGKSRGRRIGGPRLAAVPDTSRASSTATSRVRPRS